MFHVKINEINERCRRDPAAFIEESERSYTNVIESIADCICENRYDRTILLLNGPSSSGKTTTSHRIRDAIERRGICSYAISMDDYYLSRGSYIVPKDEEGHDDLESPLCMDLPMLSEHLAALVRGETIEVPTYDFMRHIRTDEVKEVRLEKGEIAVIEGIHALNDVLMEKVHLMNGPYLTNAAMLLFSKDPEKWQLGAYVKIGYFETDADLLYQDEIHGSILEQIDKIVELVYLKYMRAKITYEGMQRIERYFVPEEALREALLNALCHKQYQSGVPIQISVYEDKLYIANCGCLPENWTLENLMSKHASSPYNPNIAHVFYLAGFIESWGRGIEKICSACEKDGVPQPEYTINPGDIMIKFTAPEDRLIRSVTSRVTEKVTDKVTDTLDETSLKILNLLAVDPAYTTTFLAENLSLSRKTVSLRLKMLKGAGLIERIGRKIIVRPNFRDSFERSLAL